VAPGGNAGGEIAAVNQAPEFMAELTKGKNGACHRDGNGTGAGDDPVCFQAADVMVVVEKPVVIDADALNILAGQPVLLADLAKLAKDGER